MHEKKVFASIDLCSEQHSLMELSRLAGIQAGPDSHDKGAPGGRRGPWSQSVLRIASEAPPDSPLHIHLENLLSRCESLGLHEKIAGAKSIKAYANFGLCFSTAAMTIEINPDHLSAMARNNLTLEISAYPSREKNNASLS